jgi:predicted TIM-barrel fold metal-dependent hydrolase
MEAASFTKVCAVGLVGIEGYDHKKFLSACKQHKNIIPVAGIELTEENRIEPLLIELKAMGYRGVKLHPRDPKIRIDDPRVAILLKCAKKTELPLWLCTYAHGPVEEYPSSDPFYAIVNLLKAEPEAKVILVHGGDVRILQYAELVRFSKNLLLDLSLTLMKYEGSSIDNDISFLFSKFDRKICVGSDFPEYSLQEIRKRYEYFAKDLSLEKRENIAFRNLSTFLELA